MKGAEKRMKYHKCINFLISIGAQNTPHSGKTFFQHCVNVYNFLRKTNYPDDICYAGLFHSIYGNEIFNIDFKVERNQIKELIGEQAESIVYYFNSNSREKLEKEKRKDILPILIANKLDNQPLFELIDNVFDEQTIDKLYGEFRDFKSWKFTGSAGNTNHRKLSIDLQKKEKIDRILFDKADEILKTYNLKEFVKFRRAYASGMTHGTIHNLHVDDGFHNLNEIFTIMFYLNKEWDVTFAGETIFYYADNETIQSILPKPGRVILFDGAVPHLARDPSRICSELRMVATFKYQVGK